VARLRAVLVHGGLLLGLWLVFCAFSCKHSIIAFVVLWGHLSCQSW
jgi:hypothetical protein